MITRIREVRRARGLTLDDVARRCAPPTTAQTIGRLETGTRTVSIGWLNRIARALGVDAQDLVDGEAGSELPVIALLGASGAPMRSRSPLSSSAGSEIIAPATKFGAIGSTRVSSRKRSTAMC